MALRRYGYYLVGSLRYGMVVPTIQSFEAMTGRMTVDHCGMVWYHTIPYLGKKIIIVCNTTIIRVPMIVAARIAIGDYYLYSQTW